jgi:hypothetical protein
MRRAAAVFGSALARIDSAGARFDSKATAVWNGMLFHSENMKIARGVVRPSGTHRCLHALPRVPLRSTLGYFRAFSPGTERVGVISLAEGNFHGSHT